MVYIYIHTHIYVCVFSHISVKNVFWKSYSKGKEDVYGNQIIVYWKDERMCLYFSPGFLSNYLPKLLSPKMFVPANMSNFMLTLEA